MKTFLLLFILALLFVIGSASAMRYLDKRIPKSKEHKDDDSRG
jgi:hypothetical protein